MIKEIQGIDILPYIKEAKKSGLCFAKNTIYYGCFDDNVLFGFAGLLFYGNKVVFKSIYVLPQHRGRKVFKNLLSYMIKVAVNNNVYVGEATCTKLSLREFQHRGFIPIKQYKNYIKVRHENLQQAECLGRSD